MWKEITGLVLKEQPVGEKDKIITVLTAEGTLLRCFARMDEEIRAASQPICASRMMIHRHAGGSLTAREFEPIEMFPHLRKDEQYFAISQYFAEIVLTTLPEETAAAEVYELLMQCLLSLDRKNAPLPLIKACFELKYMAISGFMPSVLYCQGCGVYEEETMLFLCREGKLYCRRCCQSREMPARLSGEALQAMRSCLLSDTQEALSRSLSEQSMKQLSVAAETYLLMQTEKRYHSLDFYRLMVDFNLPREMKRKKSDKPLKTFHYIESDTVASVEEDYRTGRSGSSGRSRKRGPRISLDDLTEDDEDV